ncbi:MAG: alpha/beta hydrolase fold domain-containing protein [Caulobacterales bacterium]
MDRRTLITSLAAASLAAPGEAYTRAGRLALAPRTYRYAETPGVDPDLQSLDLYGAPGQGRPILAFIHGGGWRIGDKANPPAGADKARVFTERGYLYASLNYRLSPAVRHPAHIEDVAAAIAWLFANAKAQGGDPSRIVVMGHSAGAHLAALVAADPRWLGAHGLKPRDLKGAILLDGAGYDVATQAKALIARGGFMGDMYGDAFGRDGALWRDASPVFQLDPARPPPPFLIFHTQRPDATRQSRLLAEAVRKAGGAASVAPAFDKTHASINNDIGAPGDKPTTAIFDALRRWGAAPA